MKAISRVIALLGLLGVVFLTACGGGSDVSSGGVSLLAASFTPQQLNPGPNSVSLQEGASSGNVVTVFVQVTDTVDLTGGTFDLFYDSARFTFVGFSAGDLFESDGVTPLYGVNEPVSGHLVVGVGSGTAVAVNGSETLIRLSFRADAAGSGPVTVDLADLLDDSGQAVAGVVWSGGTLVAS